MRTMAEELDALLEATRKLESDRRRHFSQPREYRDPDGNAKLDRQQLALTEARAAFLGRWLPAGGSEHPDPAQPAEEKPPGADDAGAVHDLVLAAIDGALGELRRHAGPPDAARGPRRGPACFEPAACGSDRRDRTTESAGRGARCAVNAVPADPECCEVCNQVFEGAVWRYTVAIDRPVHGRQSVITCQSPSCIRSATRGLEERAYPPMFTLTLDTGADQPSAPPTSDLERVFAMTAQILENSAAGRASGRVLLERDRLLWSLSEAERRLYLAWAEQENPS